MSRTLLVLIVMSLCVSTLSAADAYIWRKGQMRIMPLGDSITNAAVPGYRKVLEDLMRADGWTYRMVGGRNQPEMPEGYSTYASGFGGWQIGNLPASQNFGGGEADWTAQNPDLILFHMGTNDLQWGGLNGLETTLSAKLDEIWTAIPNATILVANVIPGADSHSVNGQGVITYNSQVDAYNPKVPVLVAAKRAGGKKCVFVDQWTGFNKATMLADSVHPNALGYEHMAQVWLTAMQASLAGDRPSTNLPPVVSARSGGATSVTIAPGSALSLTGTLLDDDGQGAVSYTWSKAAGPGAVTFANANALQATATFTTPGAYAVRLSASDGARVASDYLRVVVSGAAQPGNGTPGRAISIAFNDAAGLGVGDAAGVVAKSHWNVLTKAQLDRSMPIRVTNLVDDSGTSTAFQFRLAGNNVGSATYAGAPATADGKLMSGGAGSTNVLSHFFIGIPYARYDVYLYFRRTTGAAADTSWVHWLSLREHDSDRWVAQIYALNQPAFTGSWIQVPSSSVSDQQGSTPAGNVALIPDLDLPNLHLLTDTAGICGAQIVERLGGPAPKLGDVNHDGQIDGLDLELVKGQFGRQQSDVGMSAANDLNSDGRVDAVDLGMVVRTQGH
jgi:predicted hotdog family 3-hydroxylacyl-ACP dehydratase